MYDLVVRNRIPLASGHSWLGRMERRLLFFFGPAQLGKMGKPSVRSQNRTAGVDGNWDLRRDSTGRTYLVAQQGEQGAVVDGA